MQQKATNLIAFKTLEQEGDAKVPEENSEAKGKTTIINAREEGQQKAHKSDNEHTKVRVPLGTCKLRASGGSDAAQGLARIGTIQDPAITFPGQRSCDVVRLLLNTECETLENFEAPKKIRDEITFP